MRRKGGLSLRERVTRTENEEKRRGGDGAPDGDREGCVRRNEEGQRLGESTARSGQREGLVKQLGCSRAK